MFSTVCTVCVVVALPLLHAFVVADAASPYCCPQVEIKKTPFDYFSKYFPQEKKLLTPVSFPAQTRATSKSPAGGATMCHFSTIRVAA